MPPVELQLGQRRYDITGYPVVMGILNRTPDSFYDQGSYWAFDAFLERAEKLAGEGADILDVGGVKAGPGEHVGEQEELDRVIPAVEALVTRFDMPISVDTWRSQVAASAFDAGAVVGNDISGFADPDYLSTCAAAGASVVATHIRLAPRVPDPEPHYNDVVGAVRERLRFLAEQARSAGLAESQIMLDAGLDLGKTEPQSLELLGSTADLSALGYPVLLSASNKRFLWKLLGVDRHEAEVATMAAHALGVMAGARVLRAHDVRAARRVGKVIGAIAEAVEDAA